MQKTVLICLLIISQYTHAQIVRAYGDIQSGTQKVDRVMITIFENNQYYKRTYTNHKGKFRFRVNDRKSYIALFYKPGYDFYAYKIVNKLTTDFQNIYMNIEIPSNTLSIDSLLSSSALIKRLPPELARTYLNNIFEYRGDSDRKERKKILTQKALREQERFKNTHTDLVKNPSSADSIYRTQIGPDVYDRVVSSDKNEKYFKNEKPITEVTYNFETNRRYDGVLKRVKNVKKLKRFKPLQKREK